MIRVLATLAIALALSACAARTPPRPTGTAGPDPSAIEAFISATTACRGFRSLTGELSLSGDLRPVRGALAMSLALHSGQVVTRLVLPPGSAEEAALVPQAQVYSARHLLDVVRQFLPQSSDEPPPEPSTALKWAAINTPSA